MLISNKEHVVIDGEASILLAELASLIKGIKECLEKDFGEEGTRELIADSARLAYMTDEELEKCKFERMNKMRRMLEEVMN